MNESCEKARQVSPATGGEADAVSLIVSERQRGPQRPDPRHDWLRGATLSQIRCCNP